MTSHPAGAASGGSARAHLLVVDDEPSIRELLAESLRFAGFSVDSAACGGDVVAAVAMRRTDLVLLDVMLPDMDGFEVVRRLRASGNRAPVLFLSARDATDDKVTGLSLGGDDYVTKPFSLTELIARIEAVLRRTGGEPGGPAANRLTIGDLELDPDGHEVVRAGRQVSLSPTEFKLLHYLMLNQGRVVSKAQIVDHVWHYAFGGDTSIVESYISYLRRKMDSSGARLIHTVRGVGYVLRKPPTARG